MDQPRKKTAPHKGRRGEGIDVRPYHQQAGEKGEIPCLSYLLYLSRRAERDLERTLDLPPNSDPGGGRETHRSSAKESGPEFAYHVPAGE